jgi:hypothetical protein
MFMLTFSVLTISIVGLFVQVVGALVAYFLGQQAGVGEQMLKWHALAYQYSCGRADIVGYQVARSDFGTARAAELAGSPQWKSVFFSGNYGASSSVMIATYSLPTDKPAGISAANVMRQLLKTTKKLQYQFSFASGGATNFTTWESGVPTTIVITGMNTISSPNPPVADNSVVLVSQACP